MTNDEVSIALRERQGFLLIAAHKAYRIGALLPQAGETVAPGIEKAGGIRLIIAGTATVREFRAQMKLVEELTGCRTDWRAAQPPDIYFYRVEAAD